MSDDVKWKGNDDLRSMLVPISSLHNDPENARKHDERNLGAIRSSLLHFGQQKPIVVDATDRVLAGNGTLEAALAAGWTHIARVRSSLNDPVSQRAFAIADNRTAELAEWDYAALSSSLASMVNDVDLISSIGFTVEETDVLLNGVLTKQQSKTTGTVKNDASDTGNEHDSFCVHCGKTHKCAVG